jgi:catechol 2,3-dioxygenase-like lactoylglutathione lyase family enzyme
LREEIMLSHITVGTNDLEKSAKFYDAIAGELGAKRMFENDRSVAWGREGLGRFGVIKPFDGKDASGGNGAMAAFPAADTAQVDKVYNLALALGGKDEGAPGWRTPNFYGAYFRDLDGNKVTVFVRK